jgi:hypothetical protein
MTLSHKLKEAEQDANLPASHPQQELVDSQDLASVAISLQRGYQPTPAEEFQPMLDHSSPQAQVAFAISHLKETVRRKFKPKVKSFNNPILKYGRDLSDHIATQSGLADNGHWDAKKAKTVLSFIEAFEKKIKDLQIDPMPADISLKINDLKSEIASFFANI